MSSYRFSWLRPNGWNRLGGVGAVAIVFATPMLWSLGLFGAGEDTLKRALIFAFAGMWLFVGAGYVLGWALRGFMVRLKEPEEDEDGGRRASSAPHPPAAAGHRPGH